ncbi:hypothetical protein HMN09_00130700 [Mycena chlorophos]|uniref:Uncharacterized protein n=1 Tax=Mycena chlorophos TaxID=658473 RepID=A0A8H6TQP3_MYCCL|nr:hypothetical protein HMN09_00130700 [Mycena chlorophos]
MTMTSTPVPDWFDSDIADFPEPVDLTDRDWQHLEKQLEQCFFLLSLHDQWSKARLQNSASSRSAGTGPGNGTLLPLLTTQSAVPIGFPRTIGELLTLSGFSAIQLLRAYKQPIPSNPTPESSRRALARFIGAPL